MAQFKKAMQTSIVGENISPVKVPLSEKNLPQPSLYEALEAKRPKTL